MKDFIVEQKKITKSETSVYLILRILFIRFSHENLLQILRQLWPMIFADMVSKLQTSNIKNDLDAIFAVLKFIEFLNVVNKEFFSSFQWVFFQDTNELSRLKLISEDEGNDVSFKPFAMYILKDFDTQEAYSRISNEGFGKNIVLSDNRVRIHDFR